MNKYTYYKFMVKKNYAIYRQTNDSDHLEYIKSNGYCWADSILINEGWDGRLVKLSDEDAFLEMI